MSFLDGTMILGLKMLERDILFGRGKRKSKKGSIFLHFFPHFFVSKASGRTFAPDFGKVSWNFTEIRIQTSFH